MFSDKIHSYAIILAMTVMVCHTAVGYPLVRSDGGSESLLVYDLYGEAELDNFGTGLASAGDFNGDGIVDLVVGSPYMDVGAIDGGAAYLFLGGAGSGLSTYDFRLLAENVDDQLGYSVAGVGDLDNDGYDDIAIGARWSDRAGTDKGAVWVVFGAATDYGARQLVFTGSTGGQAGFGHSLAGGDFNGDGYSDLVVGAPFDTPSLIMSQAGKVQVFYGGENMDTTADLSLVGEKGGSHFGWSVANAGDLNGDGTDDLAVGARWYGTYPNGARGKAYAYFGGAAMDTNADVELVGANANDWLGFSVAGAGDVNGDNFDDLLVGTPFYPNGQGTGQVYLLFGSASMDSNPDVIFSGSGGDEFGWDVDGGMDLNGDGYDDVIVGERFGDGASQDGGVAHIYHGGQNMDNVADLSVGSSEPDDALGTAVAMIGDWTASGKPLAAASAVWNDAGQPVSNPMTEGAYGAVFLFAVELPGDFDGDNDVDGVDFGLWQAGYPMASGASLGDGDADGDGDVDGVDFGIWQANYPTNVGGAATIPEPATLALLLLGGLALLRRRRSS